MNKYGLQKLLITSIKEGDLIKYSVIREFLNRLVRNQEYELCRASIFFLYAELSLYLKSVKQINMFAWLNHLSRQSQLSNMAGDVLAVLMGGQPKSYSLRMQRLYKRQKFSSRLLVLCQQIC